MGWGGRLGGGALGLQHMSFYRLGPTLAKSCPHPVELCPFGQHAPDLGQLWADSGRMPPFPASTCPNSAECESWVEFPPSLGRALDRAWPYTDYACTGTGPIGAGIGPNPADIEPTRSNLVDAVFKLAELGPTSV